MLPANNIWFRLFLWLASITLLTALFIVLPLVWKRIRAERILNAVRGEHWSSVDFVKAKGISERYGGHPGVFGRQDAPCNASSCRFDIVVSNSPMHFLHLAPKTALYVSIQVRDNRVTAVSADLLSTILGGISEPAPLGAHVLEQIVPSEPSVPGLVSTVSVDDVAGGSTVNVALNGSASTEEREVAYDFNLGCLTKVRGCKHAEDFLPRAARTLTRLP
jgi:hypothetical protein